MAPGAPAGRVAASIYMDEKAWRDLRRHALDEGVSASAIVAALLETYARWPTDQQAPIIEQARTIGAGKRSRRSD